MKNRARLINQIETTSNAGPVVYWMSRDQRVRNNWALLFAQEKSLELKTPLVVLFSMRSDLTNHHGTKRMMDFILKGLQEVEADLKAKHISFEFLLGDPSDTLADWIEKNKARVLVTDFGPRNVMKRWRDTLIDQVKIPFFEVDAHNIVPVWVTSDKQEFAAYTIRPKINRLLPEFLTEFPQLKKHPFTYDSVKANDWDEIKATIKVDESVGVTDVRPGTQAALEVMETFLKKKFTGYNTRRNDPNVDALSNLSPYLHFGHISAQEVALEAQKQEVHADDKNAFLDELIIRRELSDNFCYYNQNYDSVECFPDWAIRSLSKHLNDKRAYTYSLAQFEAGETHDPAWNAAQLEMVKSGKMHGYMRMYWAKKMLEWTASPEQALEWAIFLNDKYELDGRDPNGYVGIAWALGGVHDRPWPERQIFGTIRYMAFSGLERKFNIQAYIDKVRKL